MLSRVRLVAGVLMVAALVTLAPGCGDGDGSNQPSPAPGRGSDAPELPDLPVSTTDLDSAGSGDPGIGPTTTLAPPAPTGCPDPNLPACREDEGVGG
ncbi:MAG: hypothetical protein ACRD29_19535 [Acidimicrobiales bacterium]